MQRLALAPVIGFTRLGREHQAQRVDHVRASLLARLALTEDPSNLGDRRDDPPVLAGLEDDRQIELLRHARQDTGLSRGFPAQAGPSVVSRASCPVFGSVGVPIGYQSFNTPLADRVRTEAASSSPIGAAKRLCSDSVASSPETRRAEALDLADELLADIELSRISPSDMARKTYRLARLLDDQDAMAWLYHEVNGYTLLKPENHFAPGGWEAASRSNRPETGPDGKVTASAASLGELQAEVEGCRIQLAATTDPSVSLHSSNQYQHVIAPPGNARERASIRQYSSSRRALVERVVGALFSYVVERHQELRFGAATETAFETVRAEVDTRIASLVPEAPAMLSAAFENAASDNPEHWSSAAATCRRLLRTAADALRPAGEPVNGRPMTASHYINRLVDWIVSQGDSDTATDMVSADLEYLGRRLDAVDGAGHKGAHDHVERFDAARFLTGTYLILGDILRLAGTIEYEAGSMPAEGDVIHASNQGVEPSSPTA
jgi:AbiTii-like protein